MRNLVVFDFDHSFIDSDSDHAIVDRFIANGDEFIREMYHVENMQWTDLMHHAMGEIHKSGITPNDIKLELSKLPLSPSMIELVELVKKAENGSDLLILSDANTVFIEELLLAHNIRHYVDKIITNIAEFDDSGRLHISRLMGPNESHNCSLGTCAVNICKGLELEKYIHGTLNNQYSRIIYVGDGKNDFCPITKLRESDYAFVRTERALETIMRGCHGDNEGKLVHESGAVIRAKVLYWKLAENLLQEFRLIFE
jgi:pyridoxal phosphate phosphatase PHOSPHO2